MLQVRNLPLPQQCCSAHSKYVMPVAFIGLETFCLLSSSGNSSKKYTVNVSLFLFCPPPCFEQLPRLKLHRMPVKVLLDNQALGPMVLLNHNFNFSSLVLAIGRWRQCSISAMSKEHSFERKGTLPIQGAKLM